MDIHRTQIQALLLLVSTVLRERERICHSTFPLQKDVRGRSNGLNRMSSFLSDATGLASQPGRY